MKKTLLTAFYYISFFCATLAIAYEAKADHAAAGELFYEWVSDSTYRIYYKFYRDCDGMGAPDTLGACYSSSCNPGFGNLLKIPRMPRNPDGSLNGQEVNPPCPGFTTSCKGGTLPGFQIWWYSVTVTLPYRCDSWHFVLQSNSRNNQTPPTSPKYFYNVNTTATVGCSQANHEYVEATIDNTRTPVSSPTSISTNFSPTYTTVPIIYACLNTPFTYNPGVVDPDGDSLVHKVMLPRTQCSSCFSGSGATAGMGPIPFRPGFSFPNNPFATNNTFKFDTTTGQMTFTPTQLGYAIISLQTTEYRNGIKLGTVMQDIEIITFPCTSPAPSFALNPAIQGGKLVNDVIEACANSVLSFDYKITDPNPAIHLVARDNGLIAIPGSSISYTGQGTNDITGHFTWTPSQLPHTVDSGMRILTVTIKDSTCGTPGMPITRSYGIPIRIKPAASTFRSTGFCVGNYIQLNTLTAAVSAKPVWQVVPGGDGLNSLSCTDCKNPLAYPTTTTRYIATAALSNGCNNADTIVLVVDTSVSMNITPEGPIILCKPDRVSLYAEAKGSKPLTNLPCGVTTTLASAVADTITLMPFTTAVSGAANINSTPFTGTYATARHQYLLHSEDLKMAGMYSGTLKSITLKISYVPTGTASTIFNNINIGVKCTPLNALDKNAGFVTGTTPVYASTTPVTIAKAGKFVRYDNDTTYITFPFNTLYNWDTTQNLLIDICYTNTAATAPAYTYFYSRTYESMLFSYNTTGTICGTASATIFSGHELPVMIFDYNLAPEGTFDYKWHNIPTEVPGAQNQSLYADTTYVISVSTKNRAGCDVSDTVIIKLAEHGSASGDTSICIGDNAFIHARGGQSYKWFENGFNPTNTLNCTDCADPIATPSRDVVYTVLVNTAGNCYDTFYVTVKVTPRPEVHILNNDTTIGYGASIQLFATGGDAYIWQPAGTLSSPNVSDPIASPLTPVMYKVSGRNTKYANCYSYDSVFVDVDYKGRIMVPDAFTPNGDGLNDVFRVVNITFQKLVEFRIFNRWGQEIYNTTDPAKGWDGKWKGVPQELGTYYYLIRVGYPDNTEKTFKGNVILIR